MHSILLDIFLYISIWPISLDVTQLWWKRKITCIYNQGCIDIWYNFPKTACTIDTTWSSICLSRWDLIKHNNVMILQYLFTYESGSYCRTGQFNLAISFFSVKKNGPAHNSRQDRWRSSWHCSESKTYRGIYWKPFSFDLC